MSPQNWEPFDAAIYEESHRHLPIADSICDKYKPEISTSPTNQNPIHSLFSLHRRNWKHSDSPRNRRMRDILPLEPVQAKLADGEIAEPEGDDVIGEPSMSTQTQSTTCPAHLISPSFSIGGIDLEKQLPTSDDSFTHDDVDVQYAERQFADLKRRFSNLSRQTSGTPQRSRSGPPGTEETEKGPSGQQWEEEEESDSEFDLEDVLRDRHRKEVEQDIKPKHLGFFFLPSKRLILIRRCFRKFNGKRIRRREILDSDFSRRGCRFFQCVGHLQDFILEENRN